MVFIRRTVRSVSAWTSFCFSCWAAGESLAESAVDSEARQSTAAKIATTRLNPDCKKRCAEVMEGPQTEEVEVGIRGRNQPLHPTPAGEEPVGANLNNQGDVSERASTFGYRFAPIYSCQN